MSKTFSLVCHDTKQRIWIGQGYEEMNSFYSGVPAIMERLRRFLNATQGKSLVLLCDDHHVDELEEYEEFEEPEDEETESSSISDATREDRINTQLTELICKVECLEYRQDGYGVEKFIATCHCGVVVEARSKIDIINATNAHLKECGKG